MFLLTLFIGIKLLVETQTDAATVESSIEIPQKLWNGSTFWPSDPTSRNIFEETQNTNPKECKHPCVHCNIIYNCQDMKAAWVPISKWVDKTTMGYLYNGILLSCKKRRKFYSLWQSMDREHYAKWNKPAREEQIPYDFMHMWNLTTWTNKQNTGRSIDREQDSRYGKGC